MRNRLMALLLAAAMVLALAACTPKVTDPEAQEPQGSQSDPAPAPTPTPGTDPAPAPAAEPKVMRFADIEDIRSVNPHTGNYLSENSARAYLSARLFRDVVDPETLGVTYVPEMAAELPIQADDTGTVWIIKLNPDACWANGEKMNADTWIYTMKMAMDPKLLNPMAAWVYWNEVCILNGEKYYLSGLEGAEPCTWEEVGVKKIDDLTIELTLAERYQQIDVIRHFVAIPPVYEPYYEACMNEDRSATTYASTLDTFMASGPFVMTFWEKGAERVYEKNELWPLADLIKLDKVTYNIVPDEGTIQQLFEAEEIDTMGLSTTTYETYKQDPRLLTYPTEEVTMMFINISNDENPLLGNANFRKALYYACDREVLATLELTKPWPMFLHELAGGYPEQNILYKDLPEVQARWPENNGYDPELAKQYFDKALAECNLTKGTLELMYIESMGSQKAFCEYLDSTLPTIFGEDKFETTLAAVPAATYSSAILDWQTDPHGYDVAFGSWIWSTTLYMPNYQFQFYTPSGQLNTTDYGCPELDAMYVRSLTEEYRFDQEKLINLTMEMDELFMDEMLAVPLTQVVGRTMISERVILAVDEYDPFLGYALMYADIDLTK